MKAKFLLIASFILAIGMTGCSNSIDGEIPETTKGENVLLVTLPSNVKSTRAIETPVNEFTTTGVDDVTVFLLTGYLVERVAEFQEKNINDGYLRIEQVPAQVDRVIVIANRVDQEIKGLRNIDEIRNYAFTVATQNKGSELDGRTLMGETDVVDAVDSGSDADGHAYKQAKVTLKAITARIEIGAVTPGEGVEEVELVAVYINNFYRTYPKTDLLCHDEESSYWTVAVENDPGANNGSANPIGDITFPVPSYDPLEYMTPGNNTEVWLAPESKVYAFHVFPGNIPHIVMLVKLKLQENYYEVDDADTPLQYKYGFVTFSKFNTGFAAPNDYVKEILPHNIYKMGVGAKGIEIDAKDVTDKPEKGPYDLGIHVDIAPWEINYVTPEV